VCTIDTGRRRPIGCHELQVIFRKRATNYRALLRNMTCKDKASYDYMPPCNGSSPTCTLLTSYSDKKTPHLSGHSKARDIHFCDEMQCVAVCCSVLQCVAVCCSVLQCVAVCCSVLHRHQTRQFCDEMQHTPQQPIQKSPPKPPIRAPGSA